MKLTDEQARALRVDRRVGPYAVVCMTNFCGGAWLVIRYADLRIMTSGGLSQCLRWVRTWGPARTRPDNDR